MDPIDSYFILVDPYNHSMFKKILLCFYNYGKLQRTNRPLKLLSVSIKLEVDSYARAKIQIFTVSKDLDFCPTVEVDS